MSTTPLIRDVESTKTAVGIETEDFVMERSGAAALLNAARRVAVADVDELSRWLGRRIYPAEVASQRAEALASVIANAAHGVRLPFAGGGGSENTRSLSAPALAIIDDWVVRTASMSDVTAMDALWPEVVGDLSMPLVDHVGERFARDGLDLSRFTLIAVQHLLGSSVPVFDWLHKLGVPYERMFIAGKIYSAHEAVLWRLSMCGANVFRNVPSARTDARADGSPSDEEIIGDLIRTMIDAAVGKFEQLRAVRPESRILVVDDDGLAIRTIAQEHPQVAEAVVAMEQTRYGVKLLRNLAPAILSFPTINVAECQSKLGHESALIGESVVRCIEERLLEVKACWLDIRDAVVVGYGSIGAAVARSLRERGVLPQVFDIDAVRLAAANGEGFPVVDGGRSIQCAGLVVGCTGARWFRYNPTNGSRSDIALLASASTADIEFGSRSQPLLERVTFSPEVEACGPSNELSAHSNYAFSDASNRWLLNGGFPCNFDGTVDPIPANAIQLTRALILAGACAAACLSQPPGLVPLPVEIDRAIAGEFAHLYRKW